MSNNSEKNNSALQPIIRSKSVSEKLVDVIGEKLISKEKVHESQRFANLTVEQKEQIEQIEKRAFI